MALLNAYNGYDTRAAHVADFTFEVDGSERELLVTEFSGLEELSRLYSFRVQLCTGDDDLDPGEFVGRNCRLEIRGEATTRYVHGIVRSFERTGSGNRVTYFEAELVPQHWLLTKRTQSRIFQAHNCNDMSVPGIVKRVLETAGIASDRFRFALQDTYEAREYVVQYRETDANFIFRLLEDEGIHFFFEHDAGGYRMVFADGPVAHLDAPDTGEVPYREPKGMAAELEREFIFQVRDKREVQVGKVSLDDYNFRKPGQDLLVEAVADDGSGLELGDYPGQFDEQPAGGRLARLQLEEHQCRRRVLQFKGNVRTLLAGFRFALADHEVETLNAPYLVTAIRHRARQTQGAEQEAQAERAFEYTAEIEAIPAEAPFRPQRTAQRPTVKGSQTAIVVGPEKEEIHTDAYGRVRVQFHWDRAGEFNDFSSCWMRVSQGLAGGGYGMMFLPRVGQEVIVDFLEGNPDQPIVTGRVYNNDHMPPYSLPEHKTRSCIKTNSSMDGGGTNEIRFEDAKDKEHMLLYAQRTMHMRSRGSSVQSVGWNHHLTVRKDKRELVKENKHVEVKLDQFTKIGGNCSLEVWGDVVQHLGNTNSMIWGKYLLHTEKQAVIDAQGGITIGCGSNFITIDEQGIHLSGNIINLNSGGVPLTDDPPDFFKVKQPRSAYGAKPGRDVRYGREVNEPEIDPIPGGGGDNPVDPKETERSWIEIEMVEELGGPWANEAYEVVEPDGRVHRGRLDERGQARVSVRDPGVCQIRFPNLDMAAWRRARE